jgi:hypothetical protein
MNKRIDALLVKAGAYFGGDGIDYSMFDANKFAELIVRECMSVADLPKNPSGQWDHLESSEVIAKHFGVEE